MTTTTTTTTTTTVHAEINNGVNVAALLGAREALERKLLPYIWRANYRNDTAWPERTLEIAHERARQYLSRAAATSLAGTYE